MDTKFRSQTRNLELWYELWPCPWVPMAELWVLHIVQQVNIWPKFTENPPRRYRADTKFKAKTHDLELWLWPWVGMVEFLILHIVSLRWTSDQSLKKIIPLVQEIQSGHEIQGSNLWPWTMTLTLCRHGWLMSSALSHWGKHMTKV